MITISDFLITDRLMSHEKIRSVVLKSLEKGKFSAIMAIGIFLPQSEGYLYDIIPLNEIRKPPYQGQDYTMVGLAGSRGEAMMLVARLWIEKNGRKK